MSPSHSSFSRQRVASMRQVHQRTERNSIFVYGTAPNSSTKKTATKAQLPVCRLLIATENCFTSPRSQVVSSLVFRHYVYSGVFEVDQWEIRNDIRDAHTWPGCNKALKEVDLYATTPSS